VLKTKFQVVLDFGMVPPPLSIHKVDGDLFAASWACLRETLVVGRVPRYFKEAVASGASEANRCPYCVGAHSMMFDIYRPTEKKQAIVDDTFRSLDSEKLKMWARSWNLLENDQTSPPFPKKFQSEIIGTAVYFHYLNRMVAIYLGDSFIPKYVKWTVPIMMPFMRLGMGLNDKRSKKLGTSKLRNVPMAGGPDWADQENVRIAFSQFQAVADNKITQVLSGSMMNFIETFLSKWQGVDPGLSASWVKPYLEELSKPDDKEKQLARYMLLGIGSPYMIVDEEKKSLKKIIGNTDLFIVTAWVSLRAALRTGILITQGHN
jgi:hypothetical protein